MIIPQKSHRPPVMDDYGRPRKDSLIFALICGNACSGWSRARHRLITIMDGARQ